jgi:hypothetical protein
MNRTLALVVAAGALALLWLWRGRLRDVQREKLDHFRFYEILPDVPGDTAVAQRMQLLGQLNTASVPALWFRTAKLDYFGAPVIKNHENDDLFEDKNDHLSWYNFINPGAEQEPWKVFVKNQFTNDEVVMFELDDKPKAVLVPTWKKKNGLQRPERLSHFKVYEILRGTDVDKSVHLEDQFLKNDETVVRPVYFAVPVRKKVPNRRQWEPIRSKPHLTIYKLSGADVGDDEEGFEIENQFENRRRYKAVRSVYLAVPTDKSNRELHRVPPQPPQ